MSLSDEERQAIVSYRIESSEKALQEAKTLEQLGMYNVCAYRLYYACYHAASALLINNGINANTHSGVRTMIHLHFVKTGLLDKEDARVLMKNFAFRQQCEYDDFIDASKEDVEPMIPSTEKLMEKLFKLIK